MGTNIRLGNVRICLEILLKIICSILRTLSILNGIFLEKDLFPGKKIKKGLDDARKKS